MKEKLFRIGFISKLNGYKGEIILILENISFSDFRKQKFVFIEMDGIPVPFAINNTFEKSGRTIIKLEDVDDAEYAKRLVGCEAFVETKGKKKKTAETLDTNLVGYEMIDKVYGVIGTVAKVEEYPQQLIATCVVNNTDVLIPLNEAFLEQINDEDQKIYLTLPEGLLDVYLKKS